MPSQDYAGSSELKLVGYMVYSKIIQAGSNGDHGVNMLLFQGQFASVMAHTATQTV